MAHFKADLLQFFINLAPNNNKEWFDLNRKTYEDKVRDPFKKFIQHLIDELAKKDKAYKEVEAKDCIFRINRDIRFSKDKTPYKLHVSAVISSTGKKNRGGSGVYLEINPEHVRIYAGVYEASKDELLDIREGIANNIKGFQKLYNDKTFKSTFGTILGEKNKVIPKHLKEAAEQEPLIFNKQWYFYKQFEPEVILKDDFDKTVLGLLEIAKPIQKFFKSHL